LRYFFQVIGIDTAAIAAKMIKDKLFLQLSLEEHPGRSMSPYGVPVPGELTITTTAD